MIIKTESHYYTVENGNVSQSTYSTDTCWGSTVPMEGWTQERLLKALEATNTEYAIEE